MNKLYILIFVLLSSVIILYDSFFIVREDNQAIVVQFGDPIKVVRQSGLSVKIPFVQRVLYYDKRVMYYNHPDEEVIAKDKKRLVLDTYVRYRILDPLEFRKTVRNEDVLSRRFSSLVSSALRNTLGNFDMASLLSGERLDIMQKIRQRVNDESEAFGVEVLDVRIRRADLPRANSEAIFERMKSERDREAKEFRAQGFELAQRIRAKAERDRSVILAEAERNAQITRGDGDAESIKIYIDAFSRDSEFYSFYRSMQAYRGALGDGQSTMVLYPDSDFFRYFEKLTGEKLPIR